MTLLSKKITNFKGEDGVELYWRLLSWPYCYELRYPDTSVLTYYRTKVEAVKFATVEHQRRADVIIEKLKGD